MAQEHGVRFVGYWECYVQDQWQRLRNVDSHLDDQFQRFNEVRTASDGVTELRKMADNSWIPLVELWLPQPPFRYLREMGLGGSNESTHD